MIVLRPDTHRVMDLLFPLRFVGSDSDCHWLMSLLLHGAIDSSEWRAAPRSSLLDSNECHKEQKQEICFSLQYCFLWRTGLGEYI